MHNDEPRKVLEVGKGDRGGESGTMLHKTACVCIVYIMQSLELTHEVVWEGRCDYAQTHIWLLTYI